MRAKARAHGIALGVAAGVRTVLLGHDDARPVATTEHVSLAPMTVVERAGVDPTQPPHTVSERLARYLEDEVDRLFKELLEAGGSAYKEPWDAFWGHRYAQLRDPDGTVIDLYAALPDQS